MLVNSVDTILVWIMSVASKCPSKEKFYVANTISAAVLRGIWLIRNDKFLWNGGSTYLIPTQLLLRYTFCGTVVSSICHI
jgi:hypothetical protein